MLRARFEFTGQGSGHLLFIVVSLMTRYALRSNLSHNEKIARVI